jgi:acetate---CoA ligase (ADP-forming)
MFIKQKKDDFNKLFNPKCVAIIGASDNPQKIGNQIMKNALDNQINCQVIPINPEHSTICKKKAYASVLEYGKKIDVAVVATPAIYVGEIVSQAVQKNIPYVIIISSGFKEKDIEGQKKENEISQIIKNTNTHLIGPNCLGFLTPKINLTFGSKIIKKGTVTVISQSGAIGSSLIDYLNKEQIGLHSFISLGNKTDISENELLEYYSSQKNISAIFCYLESFKNGQNFFQKASKLGKNIPIIVIKPGKTENAIHAMTSHTGALISNEIAVKTAFSQSNIIAAENLDDFFTLIKYFTNFDSKIIVYNDKLTPQILTNAGGMGVLLADEISGVTPTGLGGGAITKTYEDALNKLPKNTPILFIIITPQEVTEIEKTANLIVTWQKKVKYPIFTILPGGVKIQKARKIIKNNQIMMFDFPEDAARIYNKIVKYQQERDTHEKTFFQTQKDFRKQKDFLNFEEVQKLGLSFHLPINPEYAVRDLKDCQKAAKKLRYPVILKNHDPQIIHKTEFKAVRLNIQNENELKKEYRELINVVNGLPVRHTLPQDIITISKQIQGVAEIIIGVKRDPDFGFLLMFGTGGIYSEIMKDLSFGILPMTKIQILRMIEKTKVYQIVKGARELPKLNLEGIMSCIEKLGILVSQNPWISEIDINPLLVSEKSVSIVDFRIK